MGNGVWRGGGEGHNSRTGGHLSVTVTPRADDKTMSVVMNI